MTNELNSTANAQDVTADQGTFACPICGKDTPHCHSPEEVKQHLETEAWVEASWQQIRPIIFPTDAEAIRAVTAEMRRFMPNACGDWADKIDAALGAGENA